MNQIPLLVIADEDEQYLLRIRNYAKQQQQLQTMPIEYFSDLQKLKKFLHTVNRSIVLLICDQLDFATKDMKKIMKKILFVNQKKKGDEGQVLLKIQPLPNLAEQLIEYLEEIYSFGQLVERKTSQITAVYSPVGGVGKTIIASKIAKTLSELGQRVLYLNLESLYSFTQDANKHASKFSALIYYLYHYSLEAVPAELINEMKEQLTKSTTYQQFDPVANVTDLDYLDKQSLHSLFELFHREDLFDHIIIDLDSAMCKRTTASLELAHTKLIVSDHHYFSQNKVTKWKSEFKHLICEKSFFIVNKCLEKSSSLEDREGEGLVDLDFQLPYIPSWKPSLNRSEMTASEVFKQNVQWLCRQIYETGGKVQ